MLTDTHGAIDATETPVSIWRPGDFLMNEPEDLGDRSLLNHTVISEERRNPLDIHGFVYDNADDPALTDFIPKLHRHLYGRLLAPAGTPPDKNLAPSRSDLASLRIRHNRLYMHRRMLVNYTSYDMRRDQDTISPRCHPDVMLLAEPDSPHPYMYARVLGMFHATRTSLGMPTRGNAKRSKNAHSPPAARARNRTRAGCTDSPPAPRPHRHHLPPNGYGSASPLRAQTKRTDEKTGRTETAASSRDTPSRAATASIVAIGFVRYRTAV
ncbi:hypothetical protein NUW54_g11744 [Trametes sanguinea]|uniref:Uncharacterized protein n=1 Tax=Trametes sanguinea TaxID=158606 RepID=A0ACC1N976_9APHY|nr:hypothetical protein NUW54_g11744 [Trametes sanguinea]